jgi:CHAT domain-containing protein
VKFWFVVFAALWQGPFQAGDVCNGVRQSLDAGAYATAEARARECWQHTLARVDSNTAEAEGISDMLVEALYRNGKAGTAETLALAQQLVAARRQRRSQDPVELALSLHNLGVVHAQRGEYSAAIFLHREGLSLRSEALGADHPLVADSLDLLGIACIPLERFDDARDALQRSLVIREAQVHAPLPLAQTLMLTAMHRRYTGDYRAALAFADRALSLRGQSSNHPDTAALLNVRSDVLFLLGDLERAHRGYRQALAVGESALGSEHPQIALYLRRVALLESALGNLAEARRLRASALKIGEATLNACQPELPASLNDLALSLEFDGDYEGARRLYQRALTHTERCLGRNHSLSATVVNNLAHVATLMGDSAEAERLHRRVVQVWSDTLGRDHLYVATALDGLAEVVAVRGRRGEARALYERALAIRRRSVGMDHPDVAWTLASLARVRTDAGSFTAASRNIAQAIDIFRRLGGSDAEDRLARALELRGEIQLRMSDPEEARASFVEALATRERTFGVGHPLVAEARSRIAVADFRLGAYDSALQTALDAERIGREHLQFMVRHLPERQGIEYAEKRPKGLDTALSILVAGHTAGASEVVDNVIKSRSVVLDELAARGRTVSSSDPQLATLNANVIRTRQRFANLLVRSFDGSVSRTLIDQARQQREQAEGELVQRSAEHRAETARSSTGFEEVRRALPAGAVLLSFVEYARSRLAQRSASPTGPEPSFAVFVVRPEIPGVALVPLGGASEIEQLITAWRAEAAGRTLLSSQSQAQSDRAYLAAGSRLRGAIWDPLAGHLRGATRVFIVPDGALSLVPFAALPIGESYLLEWAPPVHYLSAERDLVSMPGESATRPSGMLALGGAAFDYAPSTAGKTSPPTAATTAPSVMRAAGRFCGKFQNLRFQPLDGTLQEVQEVSRTWAGPGRADAARVLVGRQASESTLKQEAPSYRVLHLATHGFFLSDACLTSSTSGTRGVGGLSALAPVKPAQNPLLLSGLALAGANRRASAGPDEEDGILTAEEVASLNLQGVEWAVLSACDTGVGEIKAGEGVFGLRRAFQIAGARTVVMSLWSVDDQATRVWMRSLYEGRFQRKLSTADAVHAASLTVLRDRRARGQSTHPFYWAAFVASGDWQ